MLKIGLTGGIGSGKSTVSKMLIEEGYKIIDADKLSREVLFLYPEANTKIADVFGIEFFDSFGNLDRRKLGSYVFADSRRLSKLEEILIPYIKMEINKAFDYHKAAYEKLCFLDAPTLFEQSFQSEVDKIMLVYTTKEIQLKRTMIRDNFNKEEVENRLNSQISIEQKKKWSDFIIDNSGSIKDTKKQLVSIIKIIETEVENEI